MSKQGEGPNTEQEPITKEEFQVEREGVEVRVESLKQTFDAALDQGVVKTGEFTDRMEKLAEMVNHMKLRSY